MIGTEIGNEIVWAEAKIDTEREGGIPERETEIEDLVERCITGAIVETEEAVEAVATIRLPNDVDKFTEWNIGALICRFTIQQVSSLISQGYEYIFRITSVPTIRI